MNSSVVYFVQAQPGPVKIGFTTDMPSRMSAIKVASAFPIKVLATVIGDKRTEYYFHSLLKAYQTYGEWFKPEPPVLAAVEQVLEHGEQSIPVDYRFDRHSLPISPQSSFDTVASAKMWIGELAEPIPFGESTCDTISRIAKIAGTSTRIIKAIWYDEAPNMKADVYLGLKEAFEIKMALGATRRHRAI